MTGAMSFPPRWSNSLKIGTAVRISKPVPQLRYVLRKAARLRSGRRGLCLRPQTSHDEVGTQARARELPVGS